MMARDDEMRHEYNLSFTPFAVESVDILNVRRDRGYRHSYRDGRVKHGFIYTVSGRMRNDFYGPAPKTVYASAGELIFVPKGCPYSGTYDDDDTEIKIVQFDLLMGELPPFFNEPRLLSLPGAGEFLDAFFKPIGIGLSENSFYHLRCLYDLFLQIEEYAFGTSSKYKHLAPALGDIRTHPERNESVLFYAELCRMSESSFRRLFREYTGKAPIDYRNHLRLEKARVLLQSGEYNVSETAEAMGFFNLSFFIRLYKKKYGHTPKKE